MRYYLLNELAPSQGAGPQYYRSRKWVWSVFHRVPQSHKSWHRWSNSLGHEDHKPKANVLIFNGNYNLTITQANVLMMINEPDGKPNCGLKAISEFRDQARKLKGRVTYLVHQAWRSVPRPGFHLPVRCASVSIIYPSPSSHLMLQSQPFVLLCTFKFALLVSNLIYHGSNFRVEPSEAGLESFYVQALRE